MAKLALALLAAPAVAFNFGGGGGAPARAAVDTTADIGVDPGPIEPTGPFWEDQEGLARRRAVEIKHGRIAMMAFIGHKQCVNQMPRRGRTLQLSQKRIHTFRHAPCR